MPWQEYAWRRLTEANPFPSVMGRVCPAPCESGCNRNEVEDHVGINSVEHFLGEYAIANKLKFNKPAVASSGKKVAILGGGPAGLSCAYQLVLKGHEVTIFDEHEFLGGMMRYGIPGFRTPPPDATRPGRRDARPRPRPRGGGGGWGAGGVVAWRGGGGWRLAWAGGVGGGLEPGPYPPPPPPHA